MCSCSEDNTWGVWQIKKDGCTCKGLISDCHIRSVYSISWSTNDCIATGSADNRICLFELSRESLLNPADTNVAYNILEKKGMAHTNDINCVAFNPKDPRTLASCSDSGEVKVWQINE